MQADRMVLGVALVRLNFRHSRSLKDKRQYLKGFKEKVRKLGYSLCEADHSDHPKRATLGYVYASFDPTRANQSLQKLKDILSQEFEVVQYEQDMFDYSFEKQEDNQSYWDSLLED